MKIPDGYVLMADAAARLGCNKETIRRWVARGSIDARRLGRLHIVVALADVERIERGISIAEERRRP